MSKPTEKDFGRLHKFIPKAKGWSIETGSAKTTAIQGVTETGIEVIALLTEPKGGQKKLTLFSKEGAGAAIETMKAALFRKD